MLLEECQRLLRLGGVYVKVSSGVSTFGTRGTVGKRRLHDVGNVGDVVDLVLAGGNGLICTEPLRHMSGHGHAKAMRFIRHCFQIFQRHRAVDLHLLESGGVISIGPHARLLGGIHPFDANGHRSRAIHDSGQKQTWTKAAALGDGIAHRGNEFQLVAAVAHRGDSGREINWSPLDLLEMGMHIPQPGQDGFALCVHDLCAMRDFHFGPWTRCDDASFVNHDRGIFAPEPPRCRRSA